MRAVIYAGLASTYLLDGPGGQELKVFAQNREAPLAAGAAVSLTWLAAHTVVIEA